MAVHVDCTPESGFSELVVWRYFGGDPVDTDEVGLQLREFVFHIVFGTVRVAELAVAVTLAAVAIQSTEVTST